MSEDEQAPVYYNLTPWLSYGFYTAEDVDDIVANSAFPGKPEVLRKALLQGFAMKEEEAKEWPEVTDCDLLDAAFADAGPNSLAALVRDRAARVRWRQGLPDPPAIFVAPTPTPDALTPCSAVRRPAVRDGLRAP